MFGFGNKLNKIARAVKKNNVKVLAELVAGELGCAADDVLVASTGVIGAPLGIDKFETGVPTIVSALEATGASAHDAACAVIEGREYPRDQLVPPSLSVKKSCSAPGR